VAYNYLGVAIRFAYTLGINDMNVPMPDSVEIESAVSLWWLLYSLESDICLEYGRALSIRERDAKAPYPSEETSVRVLKTLSSGISLIQKIGRR
jgi:hypothetical protein